MPYHIVVGDIVRMETDAVVNAANSGLHPGSGVCGAIFRAAGYAQLEEACRKIGRCPVGEAVITPGFRLSARYVIHAVGPVWEGGSRGEAELLRSAYISALTLAAEYGLGSVAFPLISSGVYGYPKKEAMRIAEESINDFLSSSGKAMDVYTVIFGGNSAGVLPEHNTLGGCGCTN